MPLLVQTGISGGAGTGRNTEGSGGQFLNVAAGVQVYSLCENELSHTLVTHARVFHYMTLKTIKTEPKNEVSFSMVHS